MNRLKQKGIPSREICAQKLESKKICFNIISTDVGYMATLGNEVLSRNILITILKIQYFTYFA